MAHIEVLHMGMDLNQDFDYEGVNDVLSYVPCYFPSLYYQKYHKEKERFDHVEPTPCDRFYVL